MLPSSAEVSEYDVPAGVTPNWLAPAAPVPDEGVSASVPERYSVEVGAPVNAVEDWA